MPKARTSILPKLDVYQRAAYNLPLHKPVSSNEFLRYWATSDQIDQQHRIIEEQRRNHRHGRFNPTNGLLQKSTRSIRRICIKSRSFQPLRDGKELKFERVSQNVTWLSSSQQKLRAHELGPIFAKPRKSDTHSHDGKSLGKCQHAHVESKRALLMDTDADADADDVYTNGLYGRCYDCEASDYACQQQCYSVIPATDGDCYSYYSSHIVPAVEIASSSSIDASPSRKRSRRAIATECTEATERFVNAALISSSHTGEERISSLQHSEQDVSDAQPTSLDTNQNALPIHGLDMSHVDVENALTLVLLSGNRPSGADDDQEVKSGFLPTFNETSPRTDERPMTSQKITPKRQDEYEGRLYAEEEIAELPLRSQSKLRKTLEPLEHRRPELLYADDVLLGRITHEMITSEFRPTRSLMYALGETPISPLRSNFIANRTEHGLASELQPLSRTFAYNAFNAFVGSQEQQYDQLLSA